ncbi:conserved hypothetical protein [Ricinus communis]|uniref:PB1-like domain-containing protein n=1 Tax=Ricinus communis TaxID=3988 RepID=B9SSZ1_RICCO|nr:conserved hypothetical protein [Ricinus communis]
MGEIGFCENCDPDKFGFFDMEGIIKDLGYSNVLKIAYMRLEGGGFYFFEEDKRCMEMLNFIKDWLVSMYCEREAIVELIDENQEVMDKGAEVNENAEEAGN